MRLELSLFSTSLCLAVCAGFTIPPRHGAHAVNQQHLAEVTSSTTLHSSTNLKPLYDGTNYTFPDTTSPAGIAELLEVSFVSACMELRTGHVDTLKLFIAAAIGGYEYGFPIKTLEEELEACPKQTAGRPLLPEEKTLRQSWLSIVYFLLSEVGHPTKFSNDADRIPESVKEGYGSTVEVLAKSYKAGADMSMGDLLAGESDNAGLTPIEQAVKAQSIRVAKLTVQVLIDTEDARPAEVAPPTPPIEGAF